MKNLNVLLLFVTTFCFLFFAEAQTKTSYSVVNKISLPGNGGWDYLTVDEPAQHLFVSHSTMIQVVDLQTKQLIGTIENTPGVHGIALAPEFNKGFVSNGKDGSVTVVDLKTLAYLAKIKVTGENPDAILFDPYSKKVFVYNGRSSNATVIDAKTNEVVATIALAGKPEFSVSDGKGNIYVNIEDKALITKINAVTLKVEQTWTIAPGEEPSGLALDTETNRLFAGCANQIMVVVNAADGKVITTLPIGRGCDGVKFDNRNKRIYASCGEGILTVVQEESGDLYKVIANVPTQVGARTLVVDEKTHHIYLSTAEYLPAPEATADNPRPRRSVKPGTFTVLEVAPVN